MNVTDNKYPTSKFDRLADTRTIRGTHRREESNLKWWPALVTVVILAPTAGWAISNYVGSSEGEPVSTASVEEAPSGIPSSTSPTVNPSGDPSSFDGGELPESGKPGENPSADVSATPSGQGSSTSADAGAGRPVLVLNRSRKSGLVATGKQKPKKAGYTKISTNNYSGRGPTVSTVFYAKASDAQAAKQVAAAPSIHPGNTVLAPKTTGDDQIVVVLRADTR